MFYISDIFTEKPQKTTTVLQKEVYEALEKLNISDIQNMGYEGILVSSGAIAGSRMGRVGMKTKLQAANQGISTIITNGKNPETLYEVIKGNMVGTLLKGKKS